MTHQNFVTNGASLEDCHTNFFALADLSGIKWRRLSADSVLCVDPLDDPVLSSFSKCLASDILCVWRRTQAPRSHQQHPPPPQHHLHHPGGVQHHGGPPLPPAPDHQLNCNKELWIFWYGEQPDLSGLLGPDLADDADHGSWESGLSYECRSLLFKALHNLIERCLLARGFARLGKWFTMPAGDLDKPNKGPQLTFSFNFFVHGESTVCASMDVRQHPAVCRLSRHHLQAAQESSTGLKVILSPYGLAGTLTGQSCKESEPSTQRLLDEWRQFYPLPEPTPENLLPCAVEVLVGGLRMRYPSCYVLVVECDNLLTSSRHLGGGGSGLLRGLGGGSSLILTPPTSPCDSVLNPRGGHLQHSALRHQLMPGNRPQQVGPPGGGFLMGKLHPQPPLPPPGQQDPYRDFQWAPSCLPSTALAVKNGSWQASSVPHPTSASAAAQSQQQSQGAPEDDSLEKWDFQDPVCKATCVCSRCKSKSRSSGSNSKSGTSPANQAASANSNSNSSTPSSTTNNAATGGSTPTSGTVSKKGEKAEKNPVSQRPRVTPVTPFHRRSPLSVDPTSILSSDHYLQPPAQSQETSAQSSQPDQSQQAGQQSQNGMNGVPYPPPPPYKAALPSLRASTPSAALPQLQSDSPHPSTPSMLDVNSGGNSGTGAVLATPTSGTGTQGTHGGTTGGASSASTTDPAMPTLSPHPPQGLQEEEVKIESQESLMVGSSGTPAGAVAQSPLSIPDPMSNSSSIKTEKPSADQQLSPYQTPGSNQAMMDCKGESSWPPSVSTPNEEAPPNFPLTPNNSIGGQAAAASAVPTGGQTTTSAPSLFSSAAGHSEATPSGSAAGTFAAGVPGIACLKRPMLSAHSHEDSKEEDLRNGLLYDYSSLATPPWEFGGASKKRQRVSFGNRQINQSADPLSPYSAFLLSGASPGGQALVRPDGGGAVGTPGGDWPSDMLPNKPKDPYEFNDEFDEEGPASVASSSSAAQGIFRNRVDPTQIKEEDKNKDPLANNLDLQASGGEGNTSDGGASSCGAGGNLSSSCGPCSVGTPGGSKGASGGDGCSSPTPPKGDPLSVSSVASPPTPRNQGSSFTREEDLQVTDRDLEQIFDTSSDESSDDMFQAPSTPSSLTAKASASDDAPSSKSNKNSNSNAGILGAAELTRMFPTPPSLEHTVAQSPSGPLGLTDATLLDTGDMDWSYVYKLPVQQKFISSSRYSALTNLSSSCQSAATLPSDCHYKPSWQQQQQQHPQPPQQSQPHLHPHHLPQQHHSSHPLHQLAPHHHHHHPHPHQQQQHLQHQQQQHHHHPPVPLPPAQQQQHLPPHHMYHHQPPSHQGYPGPPPPHQHPGMHPLSHHPSMQQQQQHHPVVPHPHMQQLPPHMMQQQHGMHPMQQSQHYPPNHHGPPPPPLQHPQHHHHHPSQMMAPLHHPHHYPQQQQQQQQQQPPPHLGHSPLMMDRHPMNYHPMMGMQPPDHPERMMGMPGTPGGGPYPMDQHPLDHRGPSEGGPVPYDLHSPNCLKPMQQQVSSEDSSVSGPCVPEAHSLVVNLVLSDSMLNLYKDHNFAGCNVCVCNMNIKGADAGIYLPDFLLPNGSDEPQYKCTCGFSAVVNRHNSYRSGLFYEDEVEVTGIQYEAPERHHKHLRDLQQQQRAMALARLEGGPHAHMNGNALSMYNSGKELDQMPTAILDLIKQHCSTLYSACSVFYKAFWLHCASMAQESPLALSHNALVVSDHCELGFLALETGRQSADAIGAVQNVKLDDGLKALCLHKWPYLLAKLPPSNQDTVGLLRSLQPLLQEAVQKKRQGLWEVTYKVSGPLTWRQFHRLAGRGTEDQCEPQPIPTLLVGHDKDWLGISPFALKFWDKLLLEPYPSSRDVAYVVVAPDNEYLLSHLRTFFRELSSVYEVSRMGRHCPINKVLRDGILRVGKTAARTLGNQPVDDWFNQLGKGAVAAKIKLYAQACRYHLAPHLKEQSLDRSLLEGPPVKKAPENPTAASPMPPSTPEGATSGSQQDSSQQQQPGTKPIENGLTESASERSSSGGSQGPQPPPQQPTPPHPSQGSSNSNSGSANCHQGSSSHSQGPHLQSESSEQEEDGQGPSLVIYLVEPFSYNSIDSELYRLATLGLLRCYTQMLRFLPERILNSIHLQVVTLDCILSLGKGEDGSATHQQLRELAFSVFSQCRRLLAHQSNVKSLTGFGPAAAQDLFLKGKHEKYSSPYRLLSLPFILAPQKDKQTELGEMYGDRREKSGVFLCTYCLTSNQKWLLASCTNDKGEILETCTINVAVPNRTRRKKASARKMGLHKLLEFIVGVLSNSTQPWRLIVGRLGRVGHGELREWASLLSRKSLLRYSRQLREQCMQCSMLSPSDTPCILSACLVSLEPDAGLRVMSDQFTPDDRFTSSCHSCDLSTPQDATCTHILVFPTSATTQSSQATFHQEHLDPLAGPLGDDDIFQALNDDDINVGITDIFQWTTESPTQSPSASPSRRDSISQPGSPGGMAGSGGRQSPFQHGMPNRSSGSMGADGQEEPLQLLQQPLALGYYVSTATTGPLPRWFWSSCPHLQNSCPSFLKSALLIHSPSVQQSSDDLLHANPHARNYHPLDSNLTTDVLRYVLEGYNALSWLSLDPVTHDRRSCLPVNIQVLMQIYHAFEALT